jgi:hypothetical protein
MAALAKCGLNNHVDSFAIHPKFIGDSSPYALMKNMDVSVEIVGLPNSGETKKEAGMRARL